MPEQAVAGPEELARRTLSDAISTSGEEKEPLLV
jgi:hypothetical protein